MQQQRQYIETGFLKERVKKVGGKVDWKNVSPREMQDLTQRMFDGAGVPDSPKREYYKEFNKYIYGLD